MWQKRIRNTNIKYAESNEGPSFNLRNGFGKKFEESFAEKKLMKNLKTFWNRTVISMFFIN